MFATARLSCRVLAVANSCRRGICTKSLRGLGAGFTGRVGGALNGTNFYHIKKKTFNKHKHLIAHHSLPSNPIRQFVFPKTPELEVTLERRLGKEVDARSLLLYSGRWDRAGENYIH